MIAIDDTEIIFHRFGIQSTPKILLVVADNLVVGACSATTASDDGSHTGRHHHHQQYQQPLIVGEYKGITYMNVELMTLSVLRSYYYSTYLTSLLIDTNVSTTTPGTSYNDDDTTTTKTSLGYRIEPTIQTFTSTYEIRTFLYHHRHFLLSSPNKMTSTNRQTLSVTIPIVERICIEYLIGWSDNDSTTTMTTNNVTVLVQHRCSNNKHNLHGHGRTSSKDPGTSITCTVQGQYIRL
jgi:hypothetical protein